ncbi:zinc finger bed domain-containing protein 1-like [Gigaspora margarita]|uniref:Zinc finger bed domain-containing protein 1-like n=1 Tax=Gigaspora margarita TaxID=4874 RepID=A0A8H4A2T6_GIGMA|nr:zinc finger bed domain-containing protein 1-like [Gigaspora margarita]
MASHNFSYISLDSSSIALQDSSEEAEKEVCSKHPGGRPPDPVWDHFFATPLKSAECEDKNLDNKIREKYQEIVIQRQKLKEKTQASGSKNQSKKQKININYYWKNENQILAGSKKEAVDHAIIKAFAMCGLPFFIIENPWFINILKSLRSSYTPPTREYLANTLLNEKVIKVNWKTKEYLKTANNLTLGLDGWTNSQGTSIYNFMIKTSDHKEFLYAFHDLSYVNHTANLLFDEIEKILIKIGPEKFIGIISDNASAISATHRQIYQKYPFIFNLCCIVHFINLISQNILKCGLSAHILKYCNKIYHFFKACHLAQVI